jgi:hypothetical protein
MQELARITRPRPGRAQGRKSLQGRDLRHLRYGATVGDLGSALLDLLGERGCVELLAVLELPEAERAALVGQLHGSERGQVLADVESDPDDLVRLRLIAALREVLG